MKATAAKSSSAQRALVRHAETQAAMPRALGLTYWQKGSGTSARRWPGVTIRRAQQSLIALFLGLELGSGARTAVLGAMIRGLFASALMWLFALPAFGQMAADLARGTPAETVIQKYGWPRGKSVANGRESWLYDRFQVMFEDGKVVSVAYISPTSPGTTKSIPAAAGSAAANQTLPAVNQNPSAVSSGAVPAGSASIGNKTGASTVEPMFSRPVFWGVVLVGALGFGAAIIVPLLVRRGNEKSTAITASDAPVLNSSFRPAETYGGTAKLNGTASPPNHSNAAGSVVRRRGEAGTSPGTRSHPPTGGTSV